MLFIPPLQLLAFEISNTSSLCRLRSVEANAGFVLCVDDCDLVRFDGDGRMLECCGDCPCCLCLGGAEGRMVERLELELVEAANRDDDPRECECAGGGED
eukprot:1107525_1